MIPQINGTIEQNRDKSGRLENNHLLLLISSFSWKWETTIYNLIQCIYKRRMMMLLLLLDLCLIDIWYMSWYKYKLGKMTYQNKYNKFQNLSCEPPKREPSTTQQSSNIRVHCMISFEGIWFMIKTNKRYVVIWSKEIRNKV